jgi:hypothetical protein
MVTPFPYLDVLKIKLGRGEWISPICLDVVGEKRGVT